MRPVLRALAVLAVLTAPLVARAADTFTDAYERGLTARRAGDFPAAEAALREAVTARPDSAEALNLLALVQAYQQHYGDAEATIGRAAALAPNDLDITLTQARIFAWTNRYDRAEQAIDRVLAARPNDGDALALKGRIALYQNKRATAREAFAQAVKIDPRNLDAVLGLGDVARADGDEATARRFYLQAQGIDAGSRDVADRLSEARNDGPRWRLDLAGAHSWLKRTALADWSAQAVSLRRELGPTAAVWAGARRDRRFGLNDVEVIVGGSTALATGLLADLEIGHTPNVDFMPEWRITPTARARIADGTTLLLEGNVRDYATGTVTSANAGIEQYVLDGRLLLAARFINSFDPQGRHLTGWSAATAIYPIDRLSLRIGYADAPESDAGIVAGTRTLSAGMSVDVSARVSLRLDFAREKRENSYTREELTAGIAVRF